MMLSKFSGRPPDIAMKFAGELGSPGKVRLVLRRLFSDGADPIAADVVLAASELVSNVVQHTDGGGWVRAWDPKPDVPFLLEVEDTSPQLDVSSPATEHGGHGLEIVQAVADDWGVRPQQDGKTVWASFDRNKRSRE